MQIDDYNAPIEEEEPNADNFLFDHTEEVGEEEDPLAPLLVEEDNSVAGLTGGIGGEEELDFGMKEFEE